MIVSWAGGYEKVTNLVQSAFFYDENNLNRSYPASQICILGENMTTKCCPPQSCKKEIETSEQTKIEAYQRRGLSCLIPLLASSKVNKLLLVLWLLCSRCSLS